MYVRVNGHLKSFQGAKQLVAFSVRYGYKFSCLCVKLGHAWRDIFPPYLLYLVLVLFFKLSCIIYIFNKLYQFQLVDPFSQYSYVGITYNLYVWRGAPKKEKMFLLYPL